MHKNAEQTAPLPPKNIFKVFCCKGAFAAAAAFSVETRLQFFMLFEQFTDLRIEEEEAAFAQAFKKNSYHI